MPKLILKGWMEVNDTEPYSNIPKRCPKCGGELMKVDALALINIYWVGCRNLRCRWQGVYEL